MGKKYIPIKLLGNGIWFLNVRENTKEKEEIRRDASCRTSDGSVGRREYMEV